MVPEHSADTRTDACWVGPLVGILVHMYACVHVRACHGICIVTRLIVCHLCVCVSVRACVFACMNMHVCALTPHQLDAWPVYLHIVFISTWSGSGWQERGAS